MHSVPRSTETARGDVMATRSKRMVPGFRLAWLVLALAGMSTFPPAVAAERQLAAGAGLVSYQPRQAVAGELRLRGSPADRGLIEALQSGFAGFHPQIRFSHVLHGPESTLAGVY